MDELLDNKTLDKGEESKTPKNTKKKNKVLSIIGDVVFFLFLGLLGAYFIYSYVDIKSGYKYPFFGTRQSVVVSESMSEANPDNTYLTETMKRIQKYDVIYTKTYKSYDDIKLYDVATYYGSGTLICHRVVDKYEDNGIQYVVFRGDANANNDAPVPYSSIRGKVVNVMPKAGRFVLFIQSPYFLIALFGTGFFILLGMFIYDYEKDKDKKKKELMDKENSQAEPH